MLQGVSIGNCVVPKLANRCSCCRILMACSHVCQLQQSRSSTLERKGSGYAAIASIQAAHAAHGGPPLGMVQPMTQASQPSPQPLVNQALNQALPSIMPQGGTPSPPPPPPVQHSGSIDQYGKCSGTGLSLTICHDPNKAR